MWLWRGSRASARLLGRMGLWMPPMPSRPILVRVALAVALMAALVALADGVVRQQLQQATGEMASLPATEVAQTTGAIR